MTQDIPPATAALLRRLAKRYETAEFLRDDPAQFMHRYETVADMEMAGFLSALLAFGKRTEILAHLERLFAFSKDTTPTGWLLSGQFLHDLPDSPASFYRVFSFQSLRLLCNTLADILRTHGSLGSCLQKLVAEGGICKYPGRLAALLASLFPSSCSPLVSHGEQSASKRLNLFLRWMVRSGSPVDLGLWTWYPRAQLIMPMDTHVLEVAKRFALLPQNATATLSNAIRLTGRMLEIFPKDPLKADFALFGYGVEQFKTSKHAKRP